ncbi:Acylphosphatase-like protein [Cordyceps militaris CM01]|uniref:Acylphosphatase-like protein n=1 Tax=Cordyceps militaris (strain CM01) TaxID=983644 RepID=G3JK45_CORMM|nr:Acylphosphatase-like protein [Cordyceps militaris CM01]EGX92175.1 Acylphosphatase-like protein [Cordyceps militaris CM01]
MTKRVRSSPQFTCLYTVLMLAQVYFVAHGGTVQGVWPHGLVPEHARQQGKCKAARPSCNSHDMLMIILVQVQGEAQGEDGAVDKLIKDVDQGPRGATIVKLTQEARDVVADEAEFTIRH